MKLKQILSAALTSIAALSVVSVQPAKSQAIEALASFLYEQGVFNYAAHSGSNQCRSLERYNRTVNMINNANTEAGANALEDYINASDMQKNCVRSIYGGDLAGLWNALNAAQTEYVNKRHSSNPIPTVGLYKIRNKNYNKCLNLQPHENRNAGRASVWDCVTNPDQEWYLDNITHNAYKIRNKNYNKCLNLQASENKNNGQVSVYDCMTHRDQEWFLEGIGNSNLNRIFNSNYAMCLNLPSNEVKNPGMAQVYDCVEHPDQQWYLEKID